VAAVKGGRYRAKLVLSKVYMLICTLD